MSYVFETINGQRVEQNVAAAFRRMDTDFEKAFPGVHLEITSGTRTDAEQEAIFRVRYVTAANLKGRKAYDVRNWKGTLWYRISNAGTVAVPGQSNHQESGPNGPRSLDIRDTGSDKGVMTRGTARDNWMRDHAKDYGFENEGYNFGEPWHKTYRGSIGGAPSAPANQAPGFNQDWYNRQVWMNAHGYNAGPEDGLRGLKTIKATKAYQTFLRAWGYTGLIDGDWQGQTQAAHQRYADSLVSAPPASTSYPAVTIANVGSIGDVRGLQWVAKQNGYTGKLDNKWGGGSQGGLQNFLNKNYGGSIVSWLTKRWGYSGDNRLGPNMKAALQRANAENARLIK